MMHINENIENPMRTLLQIRNLSLSAHGISAAFLKEERACKECTDYTEFAKLYLQCGCSVVLPWSMASQRLSENKYGKQKPSCFFDTSSLFFSPSVRFHPGSQTCMAGSILFFNDALRKEIDINKRLPHTNIHKLGTS